MNLPEELLRRAEAIGPVITAHRRHLHQFPEAGPDLPNTVAYVREQLEALGYAPKELGGGLVADLPGKDTGRCLLLRADMDALRIRGCALPEK